MASPAKKIFLTFLLLGMVFAFPSGNVIVSAQETTTSAPAAASANSIENIWNKNVIPVIESCRDTAITFFNEIKDFAENKKDIGASINAAADSIRAEYGREIQDLKQGIPETFNGPIQWSKNFYDNWYKNQ